MYEVCILLVSHLSNKGAGVFIYQLLLVFIVCTIWFVKESISFNLFLFIPYLALLDTSNYAQSFNSLHWKSLVWVHGNNENLEKYYLDADYLFYSEKPTTKSNYMINK